MHLVKREDCAIRQPSLDAFHICMSLFVYLLPIHCFTLGKWIANYIHDFYPINRITSYAIPFYLQYHVIECNTLKAAHCLEACISFLGIYEQRAMLWKSHLNSNSCSEGYQINTDTQIIKLLTHSKEMTCESDWSSAAAKLPQNTSTAYIARMQ